jgi:hypothetical protein
LTKAFRRRRLAIPDRRFFKAAADALGKAQRCGLGRIGMVDLRPRQQRRKAG